jgi:Secretion system C-terminal sorting domain
MKNILTTFLFVSFLTATLNAQIYVNTNAIGANNGTSWANAYTSLGTALSVATSGTQIWVAVGTYKPDRDSLGNLVPSNNRNKTFFLPNGVLIYGGFSGSETNLSQRNVAPNLTILSGDIGVANDSTDNIYHVLFARNLTTATRLDAFTITLGRSNRSGGGLDMNNCDMNLTIANCVFSNHSIEYGGNGAAIYCLKSGLNVETTTFQNNKADEYAGAIFCPTGSTTLSLNLMNCNFIKNTAFSGGAIVAAIKIKANGCDFTKNAAYGIFDGTRIGGKGGAVLSQYDMDLTNCNFYNNSVVATSSSFNLYGGAICQLTGHLTLNQCGFLSNFTYATSSSLTFANGGAVYTEGGGDCTVSGCLFYGNYAEAQTGVFGAGLSCKNKNTAMTNSVFDNNEANCPASALSSFGGGFSAIYTNSNIINGTFTNNKAGLGGGISTTGASNTTNIKNTILWSNSATSSSNQSTAQISNSTAGTITYSLVQSGIPSNITNGGNNLAVNPLFVNIKNVGGVDNNWPTADDGLMLQAGSPAAITGTLTGAPTIDVLGVNRVGYCSMGAYQRTAIVPVTWIDFQGKTDYLSNLLTWHTAEEINNLGFDIERSMDGINFDKIGFVKAKGRKSAYEFTDNTPLSISYYRLSQNDFDGTKTRSKIITLKHIQKVETVVYPNPANDFLRFDGISERADIDIFNLNGQLVLSIQNAQAHINIDVSALKSGHYSLKIQVGNQITRQSFIKI